MGSHERDASVLCVLISRLILHNSLKVIEMEENIWKRLRLHHNLRKSKKSLSYRILHTRM